MTISQFITFMIGAFELFAGRTNSQLDDQAMSLLRAIQNSPEMLAWLEQWIPARAAQGAISASSSERLAAQTELPEAARAIGGANIDQMISVLLILVDLYKRYRDAAE